MRATTHHVSARTPASDESTAPPAALPDGVTGRSMAAAPHDARPCWHDDAVTALTRLGFATVDDPDREGAVLRDVTLDGVGIEEAVLGPWDDLTPTGIQSPPSWDRPAYLRSLVGEGPSLVEDMAPGRVAILCCSACGDPWCGYVGARIEMTDEHVLWTDVRFEFPPGMPEAVPSGIGSRLRRLLGRARPEDLEPWRPDAAMPNVEIAFERGAYEDAVRRELAAAERAATDGG